MRFSIEEPILNEDFVKEIGEMFMQIQSLLRQGLAFIEPEVNYVINNQITDKRKIDRLLSDLLDYTQIDEGLDVFKRLCRYSYKLYPRLTIDYVYIYRDLYDPEYEKRTKMNMMRDNVL